MIEFDKQRIEQLYWVERLTITKIANIFNTSPMTIYCFMKDNNIRIRSKSEALKGRSNPNKGKTIEEMCGEEKGKQLRELYSINMTINNPMKNPDVAKKLSGDNNNAKKPESREKIRISKLGNKANLGKHYTRTVKFCQEMSILKKEFCRLHPEKHPNLIMAKNGHISRPQKYLYSRICNSFPEYLVEMEHPIFANGHRFFIDVAIPCIDLGIEYNGNYWHSDVVHDNWRKKLIESIGWKLIIVEENFSDYEGFEEFIEQNVEEQLCKITGVNHINSNAKNISEMLLSLVRDYSLMNEKY